MVKLQAETSIFRMRQKGQKDERQTENPQRADKIWNRWMVDKNFKQTAGKKWTEMMRPVKDGRQTKISDKNFRGQKTDKISNRKDRERDRTGKISEGTKNTHRQKTEDRWPIFQSV
jgi:hypothetical protein